MDPVSKKDMLWELYNITGLNLKENGNGGLEYAATQWFRYTNKSRAELQPARAVTKPKENVPFPEDKSSLARKSLLRSKYIGFQSGVINIITSTTQSTQYLYGTRTIVWNPMQIGRMIETDKFSFGIGMGVLHEFNHSPRGGDMRDIDQANQGTLSGGTKYSASSYKIGENEKFLNRVRKQLGPNYGKRLMYNDVQIGTNTYMPFDRKAKISLKKGQVPTTKHWRQF